MSPCAPNIHGELLEAIMIAVPGASHVTDIDLSNKDEIRFTWRGDRFVVDGNSFVERVENGARTCDNLAELMGAVIKRGYVAALDRQIQRGKGK